MILDWPNLVAGLIGGIALSAIAAWTTYVGQRKIEKRRKLEEGRFQVYMTLLELYGLYNWFATLQVHKGQVDPSLRHKIATLGWRVADKLRQTDDVEQMPEILRVVFGEGFPSSSDRANALNELLDTMGGMTNPRYAAAMKAISDDNVHRIADGRASAINSHAPGRMY